jgi:hypothetical protein
MSIAIANWVRLLKQVELPAFTRSLEALAALSADLENLRPDPVVDTILADPLLTLRVILGANRRQSAHTAQEVTTIRHALMMSGTAPFFAQFAKLPTVEARLAGHDLALRRLQDVVHRAHHATLLARDIAALRQDRDPEETGVAAALVEFPELLLCVAVPDIASKLADAERTHHADDAERHVLGTTLAELQQPLAEALQLPELLRALIDMSQGDRPRVHTVQLAGRVARHFQHGAEPETLDEDLRATAEWLHLPLDDLHQSVHLNAEIAAKSAPPPTPEETAIHAERIDAAVHDINAHLDGTLDLHQMVMLALTGLHEGAGLRRVLFALRTPDGAHLRARLWLGIEPGTPLSDMSLTLASPHLFTRLLERPAALWYRAGHNAATDQLLTSALQNVTGAGPFFAMSLFVHNQPVGLVFADQAGAALDEKRYDIFKQLCQRTAEGLAHLATAA